MFDRYAYSSHQLHGEEPSSAGDRAWLLAMLTLGIVLGVLLPALIQDSLEIYFVFLALLLMLCIFLMPRRLWGSDRGATRLFVVFLALYCLYPHYISLQLPGLPWISPQRVFLAILFFVWLYVLRSNDRLRQLLKSYVLEYRPFFILFAIFVASQCLSLPLAMDPVLAFTKFSLFQLYWTFAFFATLTLIRTERRLKFVPVLFIGFAAFQCLIGFQEARLERLIWLDWLPPGFGADSEVVTRMIQGVFRADGYRVQGSFSVSLVYSEFLVLMLPFAMFAFIEGSNLWLRVAGLATSIAVLPAQFLSGSRLGMVGTLVIFVLLGTVYCVRTWRQDRRGVWKPLIIAALPTFLMLFFVAYAASPRLQALTIGGGQHQASTDGRMIQLGMAIPKIIERPFGYGVGLAGEALGFRNLAGVLTIDSYYLSLLLEVGVAGFLAYFAMIGWAVVIGFKTYLKAEPGPAKIAGPLSLALVGFITTKLVLSQTDTHTVVFVMLALILVCRRHQPISRAQTRSPRPYDEAPASNSPSLGLSKVAQLRQASRLRKERAAQSLISHRRDYPYLERP